MICDSSPLIFLAKIDAFELLKKLFSKVVIPSEVKEEVLIEGKTGFTIIHDSIREGWIKLENPKKIIDLGLGKGESAAISLAKEKKDSLIIDDAVGIKAANFLNIETIRTTTVILSAVKKKILSKKEGADLLENLLEEGYYIAPKYYVRLLEELR